MADAPHFDINMKSPVRCRCGSRYIITGPGTRGLVEQCMDCGSWHDVGGAWQDEPDG